MRAPGRRHRWIVPLLLLLAGTACSTGRPALWGSTEPRDAGGSRVALRLVARADGLAESGQARAALGLYERALREHPGDPAGASALYRLGRLHADPASGLRNYRAAHRAFSHLLADYPDSRWEAEARAWRAVVGDLLAREEEAGRLKAQIERLRRTDLDLERRR
ncbi:MAG: tetratricopeptide repeat protein [Candidatus Rokuibacteriota bacterium]